MVYVRFSGVLFDLWGTLVPPFPKKEHQAALDNCATQLGVPCAALRGAWLEAFGRRALGRDRTMAEHFRSILQRMGVEAGASGVGAAEGVYLRFIRDVLVPVGGALEVLRFLKEKGIPFAVVSNCGPDVPQVWDQTPLARFCGVCVFSCEIGVLKPDAGIYHHALSAMGLDPRQALYVGDGSDRELSGASRCGMHPLLVRVDLSNTYDPVRLDVEDWQGDSVDSLSEISALL